MGRDINDDEERGLRSAEGSNNGDRDESSSNHTGEPDDNMNLYQMLLQMVTSIVYLSPLGVLHLISIIINLKYGEAEHFPKQ